MRLTDTKIIYPALCLVSMLLSACGGGGGGGAAPGTTTVRSAYVANSGDNTISQYTIDATTGVLTPKATATVVSISGMTNSTPTSVTVDPAGKYAYVANSGNELISQFSIGAGGGLVPMNPATVLSGVAGSAPTSVTVDPTGRYAYAANSFGNEVAQFTIGAGGGLLPMTPATMPSGLGLPGPVSITVDPTGKYVYVANQINNYVTQFTIGVGGVLAAMGSPTVATGISPISVTVDPTGKYAYVANYGSNYISQYNIGVSGALSPMTPPTATIPGGLTLSTSVVIDPTGKYAYVANGFGVSQFLIGQGPGPGSGALTEMSPPTEFTAGFFTPQSITVDASGKFVYMANQSGVVAQYSIGIGGLLTAMTPATVAAGSLPYSITTAVSIQ